jgi:hypothetical protein
MKKTSIFFFFLIALLVVSCEIKDPNEDIKDIKFDWTLKRSDSLMWEAAKAFRKDSNANILTVYKQHLQSERDFWWEMSGFVIEMRRANYPQERITEGFKDSLLAKWAGESLRSKATFELLDTIQKVFPSNYPFQEKLLPLMKRWKKNFPSAEIPKLYTHVSGYVNDERVPSDNTFIMPHYFSFGLHYFLGEKFRFYPEHFPVFMRKRFDPNYIDILAAHEIAEGMVEVDRNPTPTLLQESIRLGIKQFVVDKLLPNTADSLKLYYTEKQMYWVNIYEEKIYKEMSAHLFQQDFQENRKFTDEKPYTAHLSRDSAPRLAQFFGWKVVTSYMQNHPNITLAQLCASKDYDKIFKESKYKP